jgi:hypothetical protein
MARDERMGLLGACVLSLNLLRIAQLGFVVCLYHRRISIHGQTETAKQYPIMKMK